MVGAMARLIEPVDSDNRVVEAKTDSEALGELYDRHYVETNEGELIPANGIVARYVRLASHGNTQNDLNHYIEIEVYALPADQPQP